MSDIPVWQSLSRSEKVELIRPMVDAGLSLSEIAARFGNAISRNTIIGVCSRHGLKLGANRPKPPAPVKKAKPHGNKGQPKANAILARSARRKLPTPPAFDAEPLDMEDGEGVDVTARIGLMENTGCHYIHGDPLLPTHSYCGKPLKHGSSWCPEHHARVYIGHGNRL